MKKTTYFWQWAVWPDLTCICRYVPGRCNSPGLSTVRQWWWGRSDRGTPPPPVTSRSGSGLRSASPLIRWTSGMRVRAERAPDISARRWCWCRWQQSARGNTWRAHLKKKEMINTIIKKQLGVCNNIWYSWRIEDDSGNFKSKLTHVYI